MGKFDWKVWQALPPVELVKAETEIQAVRRRRREAALQERWQPDCGADGDSRGGSVGLNSLWAFGKWISALVMPLPGLASAG